MHQLHHHEFVGAIEKIGIITPELLHVLPCNNPAEVNTATGVPFDLPALLLLLTDEEHRCDILNHIAKDASPSEKEPLFIFCPGSKIDGELACIQLLNLSPMKFEITTVDYSDKRHWNARQLRYAS